MGVKVCIYIPRPNFVSNLMYTRPGPIYNKNNVYNQGTNIWMGKLYIIGRDL